MKLVHSINKTLLITSGILIVLGLAVTLYIGMTQRTTTRNIVVVTVVSMTGKEMMTQLSNAMDFAFSKVNVDSIKGKIDGTINALEEKTAGISKQVKEYSQTAAKTVKDVQNTAQTTIKEAENLKQQINGLQSSINSATDTSKGIQSLVKGIPSVIPIKGLGDISKGLNNTVQSLNNSTQLLNNSSQFIDKSVIGNVHGVISVTNKAGSIIGDIEKENDKLLPFIQNTKKDIDSAFAGGLQKGLMGEIRTLVNQQLASSLDLSPEVAKLMTTDLNLSFFSPGDKALAANIYGEFRRSNNSMIKSAMATVEKYFNIGWWPFMIIVFVIAALPGLICLYIFLKSTSIFFTCPHCKGSVPKQLLYFTPMLKYLGGLKS